MSTTRFANATATDGDEHDPEHDRQVLLERVVDRELAEALEVEHRLGDHGAADEQGDVEPEHRHDRGEARRAARA